MGKSGGSSAVARPARRGLACLSLGLGIVLVVFVLARSAAFVRSRQDFGRHDGTPVGNVAHHDEPTAAPPLTSQGDPAAGDKGVPRPTAGRKAQGTSGSESVVGAVEAIARSLGSTMRPLCGGHLLANSAGFGLGKGTATSLTKACKNFRKALAHTHGTPGDGRAGGVAGNVSTLDGGGDLASAGRFLRVVAQASADSKHGVSLERIAAHGSRMQKLASTTLVDKGAAYASAVTQTMTRLTSHTTESDAPHAAALSPILAALGLQQKRPLPTRCAADLLLVVSVPAATERVAGDLASDARHEWGKLSRCVGAIAFVADSGPDAHDASAKQLNAMRYAVSQLGKAALSHCDSHARPAEEGDAETPASPVLGVLTCYADPGGAGPVSASPSQVRSCAALPQSTWTVTAAIKYGTKTGIYRAQRAAHLALAPRRGGAEAGDDAARADGGADPVVLKQFNVLQYATFGGFRKIVESSNPRSPLINFPDRTCIARGEAFADSVFQEQPFVAGTNLKSFIGARKRKLQGKSGAAAPGSRNRLSAFMTPSERLDVAMQILCVFEYLHAHGAGPFSFDDNHPEQYMVSERRDGRLDVTLIDIDTLQRAVPAAASAAAGNTSGEGAFATKCRCFYCRGRSNCMFINSPEGYLACGQDGGDHGDREAPHVAKSGRHCSLRSDAWFIAQVLLYVTTGSPPWEGLSLAEVMGRLHAGDVPSVPAEHDQTLAPLIERLFRERTPPSDAVAEVQNLCASEGRSCKVTSCPAPQRQHG